MGGASRLPVLLPNPFPLPLARRSGIPFAAISASAAASYPYGRSRLSSLIRARISVSVRGAAQVRGAHAEAATSSFPSSSPAQSWPEWSGLVDFLFAGGYYDRRVPAAVHGDDDDSLLAGEELAADFVKAVEACLVFARERPDLLRLLGKTGIEIIVDNGSPFLFKNGANSTRRLKSFLSGDGNSVPYSDRAKTFDIMRYVLSYASNSFASKDEEYLKVSQHMETSIRSLLAELLNLSTAESTANPTSLSQQLSPTGQNFEMKRGDWICAKCRFLNFARNMSCLECNDARPKRVLTGGEWECPQCDFYNNGRNVSCLRCDCKRPGEATGVVLLDNSSSSIQENGLSGRDSNTASESAISQRLDRILSRSSASPSVNHLVSPPGINGGTSEYRERIPIERRDPDYVPFVPLPKDMFSDSQNDLQQFPLEEDSASSVGTDQLSEPTVKRFERRTESKDADLSEMAEKLSQKDAELDNASVRENSVSDNDFPDIMPMRKGENRFVISKKKDRSLTSPQYKRRIAMEQANSSSFVPFVPFPPDYFAKKDKNPEASSTKNSTSEGPVPKKLQDNKTETSSVVSSENKSQLLETRSNDQSNNRKTSNANSSGENLIGSKLDAAYNGADAASVGTPSYARSNSNNNKNNANSSSRVDGDSASSKFQQSDGSRGAGDELKPRFSGKTLEGSLVKEPDPLDMSEEAKAARWFRRVAQIKDISELNNIPDEDFPEIMPMRKGVNRFVVSKRKTPLERRLTSNYYRKNLPVVDSNPDEDAR